MASQRSALAWLFGTLAWMRRDRKTLRLVKWYRFTAFIFAAVVVAYPITTIYVIIEALVTRFS